MKKLFEDAFVELTADEVIKFKSDDEFKKIVILAADDVADRTERTVIISGPDEELGSYNSERGFKEHKE